MIQTFIFFDIETTGFIQRNEFPKITEFSFVAVTRDNICLVKNEVPRVLQTLTVPINPNRFIPHKIEILTDLNNKCLQNVSLFDHNIYNLITSFLDTLMKPICFVAHNGKEFDYPILLSELEYIDKYLAEDILCADTLHLFKDYFTKCSHNQEEVDISMVEKHMENININQKPPNFKLITIYEHLLKVPVTKNHDSHSDCINMLKCVSCIKEYFVEWCDSNAEPLFKMKKN
ncbi:PREDICTED: three prime repair exonuclease 2 isoform X1 [Polistes canadensis]|uniref:three prime repair exonuclease 2 isoform X1 n=1 Tax=Polistes canadensis TaxID=91411 RepID=UPI000718BFEF|nr:PREDICTED: three prime repair exonuclease 2 isoform X1 [Polistes canadensis]